jgi:glycosyltransferase involved in cell wall biosynthesis
MDLFVHTCKRIQDALPSAIFVIAGDGSQREFTQQLACNLKLGSSFRMLGERSDVADILRAMDLFLICSDHEGLPTALLEAMYSGAAVVARRVGGIPEVVGDSGIAELVDSADPAELAAACLRALANETPVRRERARKHIADHFSAGMMAGRMVKVYRSLDDAQ